MKLDYNTMQPGQEFWATFQGGAIHCKFISIDPKDAYSIIVEENGNILHLCFFPDIGALIPFDNELEALNERAKILHENYIKEIRIIQKRIKMLEAENDLHQ